MATVSATQIALVRAFNRFYTKQIGLLDGKLFHSDYSLTEVRVLFEIARAGSTTASVLVRELGLDPGYLSRMIKRFRARRLISAQRSQTDGRQTLLTLTPAGRRVFDPLDRAADEQVAELMKPLSVAERRRLTAAMEEIRQVLEGPAVKTPYLLRAPAPGDYGWIIHRQAVLYRQEYGWDQSYEALVAEIIATFCAGLDAARERCWVAERNHEVVGSVFCVRSTEQEAKLRLLYVEPSARGLGIGRRLVEEVITFAGGCGYRTLTLWTNDVLVSARRIYEAAGFELTAEEPHHSFGKNLVGQTWRLRL